LITTKLIKKASPLMVVLAILAVCGTLVGAAVYLTSNTANAATTHITSTDGIIKATIGDPQYATTGTSGIVGDTSGVTYAIGARTEQALPDATITITISNSNGLTWSNQIVKIDGNTIAAAQTKVIDINTVSYTYGYGPVSANVDLAWTLNIQYSVVGNYHVSVVISGTAA
jgi:hypothetical protein